ncbi:hypothetical protein L1987_54687 [Smallanthus sonchifolius]|uniref:Uncharacterized protein n=1 Tax=Smallanthus sonchifolius TaxID=185202 RepID=A0ACB9E8A3_9ASTR|nr:hypothetical protein L1987_54687 [Smallanthus sonchifolius]
MVPMVCNVVDENSSFAVDTRISPTSSVVLIAWIHFVRFHRVIARVILCSFLALLMLEEAEERKGRLPLRFVSSHFLSLKFERTPSLLVSWSRALYSLYRGMLPLLWGVDQRKNRILIDN